MNRKLNIAQYGCGKMSVYLMKYVFDNGGQIVAAFDMNPALIGKDIGEIIGCEPKGVKVSPASQADSLLADLKPDACIIATQSTMEDLKEAFTVCAKNGINAISTCEESLFPWNSAPKITGEIDLLAKSTGCTLCGSGYPDLFWGGLITTLAGSSSKITKIKGSSSYNVEDYGIALAKGHGAGLDLETFEREIAAADHVSPAQRDEMIQNGTFTPSYMWTQNGWLCSKLGLTITSQIQKCIPHTYHKELQSSTLNMTIPAGYATGMSAVVITETKEGITVETQCIGKVYAPEEFDKNQWTLYGEPETTLIVNRPDTVKLTCAILVNRIPQLINAAPGYITTEKMPVNKYLVKPLHEYVL